MTAVLTDTVPGLGWPLAPPATLASLTATPTAPGWVTLPMSTDAAAARENPASQTSEALTGSGPTTTPLADRIRAERQRHQQVRAQEVPLPAQTRILTVANQKGGVGKTTSAVNLAAALVQLGSKVLVLDMDPQGNASTALGVPHQVGVPGIYDVIIDGVPLADVLAQSPSLPGLWCAPATIDLAGAEIELVPLVAREGRLRKALARFLSEHEGPERFDYVFIDCPPSLGLLTVNAFVAGREVLIPIQCEYYALEGLTQLLNNVAMICEHLNPDLAVSHILMTMYDGRTRLSAQVAEEVRSHFSQQVLKAVIPRSVRISEAPSHGETVITYDPSSSGALCYLEAATEMARHGAPVRQGERR